MPSISEFVPGYEASAWYGFSAPKGTPAEAIAILNKATNDALAEPGMRKKLADLGGILIPGTPADFDKFVVAETEKWGKVVQSANIHAD